MIRQTEYFGETNLVYLLHGSSRAKCYILCIAAKMRRSLLAACLQHATVLESVGGDVHYLFKKQWAIRASASLTLQRL